MMGQPQNQKSKSWLEYRAAFENFSRHVQRMQALATQHEADPYEMEASVIAVELARQNYNASRDAYARELLRRSARRIPHSRRADLKSDRTRVKAIAELLWDLTGRPEGTAEDNWYRAENIVRRAPACC
jgi:hypothetical protein